MQATYTKLKSGDWGVRVQGRVVPGQAVRVTKKSGETQDVRISNVIWSGAGISLCAIAQAGGAQLRGKRCISDGNCSSFGTGRSCGGYNCDGH